MADASYGERQLRGPQGVDEAVKTARVIDMAMGEEDLHLLRSAELLDESPNVTWLVGTGIDQRDDALSDQIGAGAVQREGAGILRKDDPQPRGYAGVVAQIQSVDQRRSAMSCSASLSATT